MFKKFSKDPWAIVAYLMSILFHPLLIPTIFFSIIVFFVPFLLSPWNSNAKYLLLIMIFIFTFLFPLITTYLLFYNENKESHFSFLKMSESKKRVKPFLLVGCIYMLFSYLLHQQLKLNNLLIVVHICIAVSIIVAGIISNFWKISIHAIGLGGLIGFLILLNEWFADGELFYTILIIIVISGFVFSARLYLKEHNFAQISIGMLIGLFISMTGMYYFR